MNVQYSEYLKYKMLSDFLPIATKRVEELVASQIPEEKEVGEKIKQKFKELEESFEKDENLKKTKEEIEQLVNKTLIEHATTGNFEEFKKVVETYDVRYFDRKSRVKSVSFPENSFF